MSKKKRAILIGAIVILLLVGAVLALLLIPETSDPAEDPLSQIEAETTKLIAENADNIVKMTVKTADGEYTIEKKADGTWGIDEFNGLPEVISTFTEVKNRVATVTATKTVAEETSDLAQYGLDKPELTVDVDFGEEKTYNLLIGGTSPDGLYCYAQMKGEKPVYALSAGTKTTLNKTKYDFLDKLVIPKYENQSEDTSPHLSVLKVERPELEKPITLEAPTEESTLNTTDPMIMTSPVEAIIDIVRLQNRFYNVFGLTADKVVAVRPTDEELASFGLAEPSSTLTMEYGEEDAKKMVKVYTGKGLDADGNVIEDGKAPSAYYMMAEGSALVYVVPTTNLTWIKMQPQDVMSTMLTLPYVGTVDSVDITLDGKKHTLKVLQKEMETTSGSLEPTVEFSFMLDGKEVDTSEAKRLYQILLASSVQGINETEISRKPELTVEFHLLEGGGDRLDFYVLEDMTTVIGLNGNNVYVGRTGYVEKLRKELNNLMEGKAVDTAW